MFKKIVSQLSFSPALVGQLGFYAKRLRKEEATRRLGLIFVALALVVQSLVVFQAPESANASNANDFVRGGLGLGSQRSLDNFMRPYDANTDHLKDIMTSVGITRDEIARAQFGNFAVGGKYSWGRETRPNSTTFTARDSNGNVATTVYARPMTNFARASDKYYGWIGHSAKVGWFAVLQACGNLVTDYIPPSPPAPTPPKPVPTPPTPTPTPPTPAKMSFTKTATNATQGNAQASKVVAKENDKLRFTITAQNTGGTAKEVAFKDYLGDTLEYATLIDRGGGSFDEEKKILSWPNATIQPGKTESRTFAVQILSSVPVMATGQSDPSSYNCVIENTFENKSVSIPVGCAPPKVVEQIVTELPQTGPTENIIFGSVLIAVVSFLYFRSRQLGHEVRLIRRDLHSGTF